MIVKLHTEHGDQLLVRRHALKIAEYLVSAVGKRLLQLGSVHAGEVLIAALDEHLRSLVKALGGEHTLCLVGGEHLGFLRPQKSG